MGKATSVTILIVWTGLWLGLVAAAPWGLSNHNTFLANFVNHEFLGFMGVLVTISLASAANIFLELTRMEDRLNRAAFPKTKLDVRHSAYALIWLLVSAVAIVIVKPLIGACGDRADAFSNGAAVTVMIVAILTLADLTKTAFSMDSRA